MTPSNQVRTWYKPKDLAAVQRDHKSPEKQSLKNKYFRSLRCPAPCLHHQLKPNSFTYSTRLLQLYFRWIIECCLNVILDMTIFFVWKVIIPYIKFYLSSVPGSCVFLETYCTSNCFRKIPNTQCLLQKFYKSISSEVIYQGHICVFILSFFFNFKFLSFFSFLCVFVLLCTVKHFGLLAI